MSDDSKRFFISRIIENLDSQIRSCTSNSERNILFAQKAFALARHSFIAESKQLIRELRSVNPNYEPRLSAWIMFAEGIIEHSDTYDLLKSRDRIIRAHLVGQAANDPTLAGTAAAWLSDLDFLRGHYKESAEYLEKAFAWSGTQDSEARSRASMVLGAAMYFGCEPTKAKYWLNVARSHAVHSGDIAMQNIILFNSSALDVARLTLQDCIGQVDISELQFAVMSAQSVRNLNTALGNSNQPSMIPVQQAELLTIQRKWQEAIDVFDAHIEALKSQGQSKWAPRYLAHRSWCKSNLEDFVGSRLDSKTALDNIGACTDPDDLSVLHYRIAAAADRCGEPGIAETHRSLGHRQLAIYTKDQATVRELFGRIADLYDPKQKNPA